MERYSTLLLLQYGQVSLCTLAFKIVCPPCLIVISESFPLYYQMCGEVKDLFLLTMALENVAQFKHILGKFVANEKVFIHLTKQIFVPSV